MTRHRSGFALPSAIITLVLLSALIAGALFVATQELRAGRGDVADQRALSVAEWALERAIANWDPRHNSRVGVGQSVAVAQGEVGAREPFDVTATRVQPNAFWMTARASSGMDGGRIPARHTIAASLRLIGPTFPLSAALSAGNAVTIDNGVVDGRDARTSTDLACRDDSPADVAGVVTPDTALVCGVTCTGGVPLGVFGTPPLAAAPGLTSDSTSESGSTLRASINLAPGAYAPRPSTANGDCNRTDPLNWGDPGGSSLCADYFPIVHASGDIMLSSGAVGQGLLIADGSIRLEAGARFVGVVIAKNDIEVAGAGAVIDGVAFANDVDRAGATRVADGGAITFNRCAVRRAELGVARLVRTRERWWVELR
jgi:hypothetical protein